MIFLSAQASEAAKKAAGEICEAFSSGHALKPGLSDVEFIIQQSITEAVDAAVASQKARYDALATKWRELADEYTRVPAPKIRVRADALSNCASELLAEGEK